jgi:hypothetical protein
MPPATGPIHNRHPHQVHGLIIASAILAALLACVFGLIRGSDVAETRRAVTLIERLGGRARLESGLALGRRSDDYDGRRRTYEGGPLIADFGGSDFADADVVHLHHIPQLVGLILDRTRITDAGLAEVGTLVELRSLSLDGTAITDAGLEKLQGLKILRRLSLRRTAVTESGIASLKALVGLEKLDLGGVAIGDAGLATLLDMPRLHSLQIDETAVSKESWRKAHELRPELFPKGDKDH